MKVTLTGINFNYSNGYNADYTGVNLNFNTTGVTFNLSGYVEVTKDQYLAAAGSPDQFTALIKQEVLNSLNSDGTQAV